MRALTIIQPWAYAILHLGKRVENRGWRPPADAIGKRILIHAGLNKHAENYLDAQLCIHEICGTMPPDLHEIDLGCIVGAATIAWVTPPDQWSDDHTLDVWRDKSQFGWVLSRVVALEKPIPCKGARKLWQVPQAVEGEILTRFAKPHLGRGE